MQDTIAAIATPPGEGGVAIIRISGPDAQHVLASVFSGGGEFEHAKMCYGAFVGGSGTIDVGYAVMFYAPKSFTGEDVAEIHCHGGAVGAGMILDAVMAKGARPAQPGEFSKRAFINGKMDLTQAEAVCDYIGASSEQAARQALIQMEGGLRERIAELQDELTDLLAETEAAVEYPDEDLEDEITKDALPVLAALIEKTGALANTYKAGRIIKEGLNVAIAGKPNVGKSSLLNALCGRERAIVSHLPGTTRDTVENTFFARGLAVNLVDTAGIRGTDDIIEVEGVKRSVAAADSAALVLFVADMSREWDGQDDFALGSLNRDKGDILMVYNKSDLCEKRDMGSGAVRVSAKTGEGIGELKDILYKRALEDARGESLVIINARHANLLKTAADAMKDAYAALREGVDMDCVTIDINAAWQALGELTGKTASEDIIDRIFERFCLGK